MTKVFLVAGYDAEPDNPSDIFERFIPRETYNKMTIEQKKLTWTEFLKSSTERRDFLERNIKQLETLVQLAELFKEHDGRFTCFVLGNFLDNLVHSGVDVKNHFGKLPDVQSHSYTHRTYKTSGDQVDDKTRARLSPQLMAGEVAGELENSIKAMLDHLGITPIGLRTPMGNVEPFGADDAYILEALKQKGFKYISSWLKAAQRVPNDLTVQPFFYDNGILEIPTVGFYDVHHTMPTRLLIFGDENVWSEEERLDYHLKMIGEALRSKSERVFVPLAFHPWDVKNYDPKLRVHRALLKFCKMNKVKMISYTDLYNLLAK